MRWAKTESRQNGTKAGCIGCFTPLIITIATLTLVVGGAYFADIHNVQMLHAGDETRFDPIDAYPYAATLAGSDLEFFRMTAKYVRSDGTLDLSAPYGAEVSYQWLGNAASTGRPLGAGASSMLPLITVRATEFGFEHTGSAPDGGDYYDLNIGLRRREASVPSKKMYKPTKRPTCGLAKLWAVARKAGVPADAVAVIRFDARGYEFEIEGTETDLSFGPDCKLRS